MGNSFGLSGWNKLNQNNRYILSFSIMLLMSFAFVVTDWMIGIFTLSDYIFGIVGLSLLVSGNYKIKRTQVAWILLLLSIISANIIFNYYNNDVFILKTGIAAFFRIIYYLALIIGVFNYIEDNQLKKQFLIILNLTAIIICAIGFYITVSLYLNGQFPYDFFWKFTRTDLLSYAFNENTSLIRTRSVFSEPAYLGYYLNIILTLNYFNKVNIKVKKSFTFLITLTILFTFSYSAIGIMFIIQSLNFIESKQIKKIKWNKKTLIHIFISLIAIVLLRDLINETIIKRTMDIISGEDGSAYFRIIRSWDYVNIEHIFLGNGIGHTPDIWNIYAYILSDLGLIAFIISCLLSGYILLINFKMGLIIIVLNFQKGGYLNPAFSIFILLIMLYIGFNKKTVSFKIDSLKKKRIYGII